jgi:hypothetical protein
MDMLALTDSALARLCIAATRMRAGERKRWLRDLAAKLDPPSEIPEQKISRKQAERASAARRQAQVRQRERNGVSIHQLLLRDICVEGLLNMMLATGRLTEREALDDQRVDAELARLLEEQGERWVR